MTMRIDRDPTIGATYVALSDAPVDRTVELDDVVLVDLSEDGSVVGIDLAFDVDRISPREVRILWNAFPTVAAELGLEREQPRPGEWAQAIKQTSDGGNWIQFVYMAGRFVEPRGSAIESTSGNIRPLTVTSAQ